MIALSLFIAIVVLPIGTGYILSCIKEDPSEHEYFQTVTEVNQEYDLS